MSDSKFFARVGGHLHSDSPSHSKRRPRRLTDQPHYYAPNARSRARSMLSEWNCRRPGIRRTKGTSRPRSVALYIAGRKRGACTCARMLEAVLVHSHPFISLLFPFLHPRRACSRRWCACAGRFTASQWPASDERPSASLTLTSIIIITCTTQRQHDHGHRHEPPLWRGRGLHEHSGPRDQEDGVSQFTLVPTAPLPPTSNLNLANSDTLTWNPPHAIVHLLLHHTGVSVPR